MILISLGIIEPILVTLQLVTLLWVRGWGGGGGGGGWGGRGEGEGVWCSHANYTAAYEESK